MNEIKVGDRVRSFDFDSKDLTGERACYVEGTVEAIVPMEGCHRYKIRASRRVISGMEEELPSPSETWDGCFYPPVNGTRTILGNVCDFVEKIVHN